MEGLHRRRAARENIDARPIDPITNHASERGVRDRTLAEISQDRFEHELFFNEFLPRIDPVESFNIVDALKNGNVLTIEQDKLLEDARNKYNKERFVLDLVQGRVTKDEIVRISKLDKNIGQILGRIGPEKAAELLKSQLPSMAMSDPKNFKKLVRAYTTMETETGEESAELEHRLQKQLARYGIKEHEYVEATVDGPTLQSSAELEKTIKKNFTWWESAANFVSFNSLATHRHHNLYRSLEEERYLHKECDTHLKKVGKVLASTINGKTREAMQKYVLEGGEINPRADENIRTILDFRAAETDISTVKIRERFEEAKRLERRRLNKRRNQNFTPAELNTLKDRFSQQEFDRQRGKKGRGLLGTLFEFIFGARTRRDIKNSLH